MKNEDIFFMKQALKEAFLAAKEDEVPVGAVVVSPWGTILARARNQSLHRYDPTAHAEILALREAGQKMKNYRLIGCSIYVTLEPCPMCAGALIQARIKRLVFATRDPRTGACGSLYNIVKDKRLNHQVKIEEGLLAEEASRLLKDFFRQKR